MLDILYDFIVEHDYMKLSTEEKLKLLNKEIPIMMKTAFSPDVDSEGLMTLRKLFKVEVTMLSRDKCESCVYKQCVDSLSKLGT